MTDNEVIKAFKDFLNEQVDGYTDLVETGGERYEFIEKELELLKETDNLINRQKAENERLESLSQRLGNDVDLKLKYIYELEEKLKTAKAEAYKECIDKVKNIICKNTYPDFDKNGKAVNI